MSPELDPIETLNAQTYLLRKWAANLGPAREYLYPAALAKELVRMADTLDSVTDELGKRGLKSIPPAESEAK